MKAWFKSKTMWLGAGVVLLAAFQEIAGTMPEEWGGPITAGIGVAIMVLRSVTTQAIGKADG